MSVPVQGQRTITAQAGAPAPGRAAGRPIYGGTGCCESSLRQQLSAFRRCQAGGFVVFQGGQGHIRRGVVQKVSASRNPHERWRPFWP